MAFLDEHGNRIAAKTFDTEYGVRFPDDGEILECDDIHEAVGIVRTTSAKLIKRDIYVTPWTYDETGEECES